MTLVSSSDPVRPVHRQHARWREDKDLNVCAASWQAKQRLSHVVECT